MDFDEAVLSHTKWKMRLRQWIRGPEPPPPAADVRRDDLCALGQWLIAERARLAGHGSYHEAAAAHAHFHACAARVVETLERGDREAAQEMLETDTGYTAASAAVVLAITRLRAEVNRFAPARPHG